MNTVASPSDSSNSNIQTLKHSNTQTLEHSNARTLSLRYPPELPVSAHRDEILAALRSANVVVVCGDTGSGKTTQLPKMALELFGDFAEANSNTPTLQHSNTPTPAPSNTPTLEHSNTPPLAPSNTRTLEHSNTQTLQPARLPRIACTQPRRLAAVAMAERVAAELGGEAGGLVGWQHRFGRRVGPETRIKFMTDGVLLAETRSDPLLRGYDVVIVDEAHERSLNVDFLLGILKRILARRRDLKVIVSSATLDVARFSEFFGGAPIVSVPGRLYPVETRWRPPREDAELDLPRDVADAVAELPPRDDVLVFLPGERDIRETADELARTFPGDDVIPLLASLPAAEQRRAFKLSPRRRIVLATNVAETSVTIPGIRCVVDSGLARISRYVHRTQVQRLQIEPVSQASARQRAGRCGRIGPGVCVRLFSEDDFNSRDPYTPPEVLRSSLAGVILTMLDLRLGDVAKFPFIDPPKPAMVHEGFRELLELGAVTRGDDGEPALTEIGRKLAKIPVEPRLARMLIAASDLATLPSAIPIVAALACDDPRRRPIDERQKADQQHAQFRVPGSDFLGTLKLWSWWRDATQELSQSKARALAKKTYLSYPKMREWRDLARQLEQLCRRLGLSFAEMKPTRETPASNKTQNAKRDDAAERLHRALLVGLLGRIGKYDEEENDYRGAHGVRFALHPSSALMKKSKCSSVRVLECSSADQFRTLKHSNTRTLPQWIVAGELVDTARLFARDAAEIDPAWIESAAGPLCRRHCHSPEWDERSGFVRATEQVTLYGLVVVEARRCDFSRYDAKFAREIFIRRGLVDGDFPRPPPEVRANNALLDSLRKLAEKRRRPEFFDADKLFAHFDRVVPADVCSADALRKWLRRDATAAFVLKKSDWWPDENAPSADFPEEIRIGGAKFRLDYRHAPDDPDADGITCTAFKSRAAALRLWRADWLVPGALPEKLTWLVSVLPSAQRRALSPIADTVAGLLLHLKPGAAPLADAVRGTVYEQWGIRIAPDAWAKTKMPPHLEVRFRILDDATGRPLAISRDLDAALEAAGVSRAFECSSVQSVRNVRVSAPSVTNHEPRDASRELWPFGTIPETTSDSSAGWKIKHFPALRDGGDSVEMRLYADARTAARSHAAGVARLFEFALAKTARAGFRAKNLPLAAALHFKTMDYPAERVADDVFAGAIRAALVDGRPPVRDAETFARRAAESRNALAEAQFEIGKLFAQTLADAADVSDLLERFELPAETLDSVLTQLAWLVYPGFPRHVPLARLRHYARYFKGMKLRLERARNSPSSDRAKESLFAPQWERYQSAATAKDGKPRDADALARFRWLLEEYRISLFAQELHTAEPVSPKRLDAAFAEVEG